MSDPETAKRAAARAAAALVQDGMRVGLGTGSTVAHLLPALAERKLALRCVATSAATERIARQLGLAVESFESLERLDIAIDGADQITPDGWLIKGGGGAHLREKVVAAAAERFVVIASDDKLARALAPPVPVELLRYGLASTLRLIQPCVVRSGTPASPDDGVIADYFGEPGDPETLAARLAGTPGVLAHGLFEPALTSDLLIARGDRIEHIRLR